MKNLITYLKTLWSWVSGSQSTDVSLDCRLTVGSPSGMDAKWKQNPFMRFAVVLTLIFTIGIGNAWADYTITFKTSGTTNLINTGGDYATSTETAYVNGTSSGVQFGSNSKGGNIVLTMTASGQVKASKITLNGYCKFASDGGNCKVTITFTDNSTENHTPTATATATATDVTITNSTKTLKSIKLESTARKKRFYVTGVTVVAAAASCTTNPTVGAGSNSSVTSTTATVSCSSGISSLGSAGCSISSYGFVIGTSANPAIGGSGVTQHEVGTSYTTTGTSFSKDLTGLSASTTYYVRPYATNGNGTGYGTQTSFTTSAACTTSPTVTAGSNSSVTSSGARVTCSSGISSLGSAGCSITSYGFVLGTSANPTTSNTTYEVGTSYASTGTSFYKDITGLSASTTYYVRPYATNGNGTGYGTQTSFTTAAAPTITISQTSRAFGDRKVNGGPYNMTFNVSGQYLTGNINLAITGTNAGMFSVNKTSLTPSTGTVATTEITVSYSPTGAGSHTATLTISSDGATSKTVALSGTGKWEVVWSVNGGETTSLVANGTKPTFPSTPSSCDATSTTFIGWATAEWDGKIASLAGKTVHTSNSTMSNITANGTTFYAVFAKQSGSGDPTWVQTTSVAVDDVVVIAEIDHVADGKAGKELAGWAGSTYGTGSDYTTTPAGTITWTVVTGYNSTGVAFKNSSNKYLYWSSSNTLDVNSTLSANSSWTVSESSSRAKIANNATSTRTICWNESSPRFAAYDGKNHGDATSSGASTKFYYPVFYKQTPGYTYSDYVTVCCTQYDITLAGSPTPGTVTGGTFNASPASACEGAEVTLSATPADGYSFAGWTVTKTASPYTDITSTNVDGNTLTMPDYGVTVNASFATLTGITVKTAPTKTTYCEGDNFDPTGLVITASFSNSTTLDIPYSGNEAKFTFSPTTAAALTTGNTSVTITYSGQTASQTITVNAKLAVTRAGTPAGTVTGGTFTVDNATACVSTTINIEAAAASHYTFGSWTITKTSDGTDVTASVSIGSASSATTSFTMPGYAVTVTATFNENANHTATFKNNGVAVSGYDGVKTYDGERPSAPTLTDVTDACDKTDCNKFYGWIAEDAIWSKTINSVAGKTIYRHAEDIPTVSGANVVYHAVWAKGSGDPDIPNTLIAKWDKQSIAASTAIKAKDKDGNTLNSVTMTSNIAMTTSAVYGYANTSISTDPVITLAGLDFSDYSAGVITFFARGSQQALVTVEYSTDGGSSYSTDHFSDGTAKKELGYVVTVPNTTTNVKISYGSNIGNFYFGSVRAYGTQTTSYDFTELTSSNTSGWSGADWDGYYLIVGNSNTKAFRSDIMEGLYGMTTVSPSEGVVSTSDLGLMFKVKYNSSTTGYAIKSAATQDYLTDDGGGVSEKYHLLETSATEAISIAYNQITHATGYYVQWATDRFGSYGSSTAPTLYKIMTTFTEFRISCCTNEITIGTPTKTGSGTVTFASGGDPVDAGGTVETCEGETTITATVTPTNGYQCTALGFSGGSVSVSPTIPEPFVPYTAATAYTLTFDQNTDATLSTTVTFTALVDHYIDNMHYNTTQNKSGNYGTAPTLSDESKGEQCTGLHYKFIGWIPESDMNMTTGVPTTTANMVVGGATGKYATGTNYYAIWAEEE